MERNGLRGGGRSVEEWVNRIIVTPGTVGVRIDRNTLFFNIEKNPQLRIIYIDEMEYGVIRNRCQANKAPRVVTALESSTPPIGQGDGPLQSSKSDMH